jgi:ubiquinone/menaquinone biosynthesis C-methylase UbiE
MREMIQILPQQRVFMPVTDVYRTFKLVGRRNFMHRVLEVPMMVHCMAIPNYASILEIGCGPGLALEPIAQSCRPIRLVGIDIEKDMLLEADKRIRQKNMKVELYQQDVRDLQFDDGMFDIVIDFGTCYHIRKRPRALREIARVLKTGGMVIYESKLNQFLSHPFRFRNAKMPWHLVPEMKAGRQMIMWSSRFRIDENTDA